MSGARVHTSKDRTPVPFPLSFSTNHLPRRTLAMYQKHPSRLCPVQGDLCTSVRSRQSGQETPALSRCQAGHRLQRGGTPNPFPTFSDSFWSYSGHGAIPCMDRERQSSTAWSPGQCHSVIMSMQMKGTGKILQQLT